MKVVNLTNRTFGRLTVIKENGRDVRGRKIWECECSCGGKVNVNSRHLIQGSTNSCGCLQKELQSIRMTTHGLTKRYKRLINIWCAMLSRCYDNKSSSFKYYGAKGVIVCDEWKSEFIGFYKWAINSGYDVTARRGDCTIDRIDSCGNYEPNNCRWVDMKTQQNNKRNSNGI